MDKNFCSGKVSILKEIFTLCKAERRETRGGRGVYVYVYTYTYTSCSPKPLSYFPIFLTFFLLLGGCFCA